MANELKIVISAVGKGIKETTKSLTDGLNKSMKAMQVFNKSVTAGKDVTAGLAGQIKGLIGAYAGFSGISGAVNIVKDSETAFYNLKSSVDAANREFENVGSVAEWERSISRLSDELVIYSDTALAGAVAKTVDMTKRLGLSKSKMEEVIKRSADLGAGKFELGDSIERVTAALRGEAEASEALGLTLNETYVKSWYEANNATQKAWKDLTDVEKAQTRYQVLLEQSASLQGKAAGSAKTFSGAIQLVKKEIENAVSQNKDLVSAMQDLANVLRDNAGEIGTFVSQLISGVAKLVEFAVKYKEVLLVIAGTAVTVSIVSKLVGIFNALNAAFLVMTGSGVVGFIESLRTAVAAASTSTSALGLAFKGFVALAAAEGVVNIVKLGKAIWDWRDAVNDAKAAQDNLFNTTDKVMTKFAEFKDVKLPDDIAGTAPAELEEFRQGLQKANAYWVALYEKLRSQAEEKTFLGTATDDAIAAQSEMKKVGLRLKEIDSDLKKIGESAAGSMKKPAEAVKATTEQLDEFEKQAKKAYEYASDQAKKYAKDVIAWEDKIKYARMSTEDKIRELSRKTMSDEKAWNDERKQADEKMYAAKEALRNKDYKLAEELAKDAEGLYAGLAKEVKASADGGDKVAKSLESTTNTAKDGVKAVGDFYTTLYTEQKKNAEDSKSEWETTAGIIQAKLDKIAKDRAANINIELKNLEAAQTAINKLTKDETKYITVVTKTVEAKQLGGPVGFARGGRLPGYGGGDRIRALLEAGEFVIRKEAVAKYGAGLFHALNTMTDDFPNLVKARVGGLISNLSVPQVPVQRFAAGGQVHASGFDSFGRVDIGVGNQSFPVLVKQDVVRELKSALSREKLLRTN